MQHVQYDIIGDIHGHATLLLKLLSELGYKEHSGSPHQDGHKVIFLGDLIDRGDEQLETVSLVRRMCLVGDAICLMGNHEFNALAYAKVRPDGRGYLREHSERNYWQHHKFLNACGIESAEDTHETAAYLECLEFFKSLPMWLDLGKLRCVHACWNHSMMDCLLSHTENHKPYINDEILELGSLESITSEGLWGNDAVYDAIECVLKGPEIRLPGNACFEDKDGIRRTKMRIKWWANMAGTYREIAMLPGKESELIPDVPFDKSLLPKPYSDEVPVIIGHYWMPKEKKVDFISEDKKVLCIDYSAGKNGPLTAYTYCGERALSLDNVVQVFPD